MLIVKMSQMTDLIFKYSGEDRDYFLTINDNPKPYEFIIGRFRCKNKDEAERKRKEMFDNLLKLGLIKIPPNIPKSDINTSHLITSNRDSFRMYVMKQFNVDMIAVEQKMNITYMSQVMSDSDDETSDEEINRNFDYMNNFGVMNDSENENDLSDSENSFNSEPSYYEDDETDD